ncbi:MAG: hypothetical protein ACK42D_01545 [Candidatus Paceibacteria bacterium]
MKKILIVGAIFIFPFLASAETITIRLKSGETYQDVAKQFNVDVDDIYKYDDEMGTLYAKFEMEDSVSSKDVKEVTDLKIKVAILEAENNQLKSKISLLEQIISLLKTIVGLRQ